MVTRMVYDIDKILGKEQYHTIWVQPLLYADQHLGETIHTLVRSGPSFMVSQSPFTGSEIQAVWNVTVSEWDRELPTSLGLKQGQGN